MNSIRDSKQPIGARAFFWIAASVILLTFLLLDAGALAWSASLIGGHQLIASIFTFFIIVTGAAITVWQMYDRL